MDSILPTEVVEFVSAYIRSLDQLEVLLLLSALPDREWSVSAIDSVVRSNPEVVAQWLEGFVQSGIVSRSEDPPVYRYQPSNVEIAKAVAALGACYKMGRHRIVDLIYRPQSPLKDLSDAFRFRRKP
jgi:hypothetical protein